ncbi:MAG: leucyl-tRNA synthetase [Parcubacteria bacterium C7867-006]|nr:MAG: leucyl-tRNA synthetase [Parcubacteria bacterium C7867-006]
MKEYNHLDIEKKWQKKWVTKKVYKASNKSKKKKYYVLDMFPYPSGTGLHVGHPKGYIGSDVFARFKRMQGMNVLHPMGYDAFGLPAEQYALEHNIHPRKAVEMNIKTFEKQLHNIGLSFDWDRKVNTTDPGFYKWTQWIFLKIYNSWYNKDTDKAEPIENLIKIFEKEGSKKINAVTDNRASFSAEEWKAMSDKDKQDMLMRYRLAYEGYSDVNWSPKLGTVLANDEIVDGPNGPVSERGGFPVEKKKMRQWFLRITAYADRLLTGLNGLDWSEHIKEIQRNWIGKSDGAEIPFKIVFKEGKPGIIPVFTTRPDTLFGATYMVLSPEHLWVTLAVDDDHIGVLDNREEVKKYIESLKKKTREERIEGKEKTGVELRGIKAINPANNEEIPVWIADYVLADYGTGAIMAVPASDERDYEFAKKYKLPIREVIIPKDRGNLELPITGEGFLINSGKFNGLSSEECKKSITKEVGGKIVSKYKMRDAIFARQRYWGEPIPLMHDKNGIITPLKEKDLPLKLPEVKSYMPTGTGESPLAGVSSWMKKGFETNTMPGWAGSSWYFLRYMDPKNKKAFVDKSAIKYWKNVDMYVGGAEHATGHLLYSRFWHKFLKDYGLVITEEPFQTLKNQGMILGPDNRKMSKRWGNIINPDDVVKNYGADTLRVYETFMGPFEASLPWSTDNIIGSRRFLDRIWRLTERVSKKAKSTPIFESVLHKTIKKVTEDIDNFAFNTAVSSMMILLNEMEKMEYVKQSDFELFLKILNPFAPHMTEEIWSMFGHKSFLVLEAWPKASKKKMEELEVKFIIQINGKVRAETMLPKGLSENVVLEKIKALPDVEKWIMEKEIKKVIFIKDKLVNLVVF